MYAGVEDIINNRYPKDFALTEYGVRSEEEKEALKEMFQQSLEENGLAVEDSVEYTSLAVTVWKSKEVLRIEKPGAMATPEGEISILEMITLDEYNRQENQQKELAEDEIFVSVTDNIETGIGNKIPMWLLGFLY